VGALAPHPVLGQLEIVSLSSAAQYTLLASRAMPVGRPAPEAMEVGPLVASFAASVGKPPSVDVAPAIPPLLVPDAPPAAVVELVPPEPPAFVAPPVPIAFPPVAASPGAPAPVVSSPPH